jgi:rod shape-determining protein MreD
MRNLLYHSILFIILILAQEFVFNNIQFSGFVNPYVYVLFILILPHDISNWLLILLAFTLGFFVDLFSETLGLHSAATIFLAYLRPRVLKIISPRDGYEPGFCPSLSEFGFEWFARYTAMLIIPHHAVLFFLESFTFVNFFPTLLRIILSIIFTFIIIMLIQLFSWRRMR